MQGTLIENGYQVIAMMLGLLIMWSASAIWYLPSDDKKEHDKGFIYTFLIGVIFIIIAICLKHVKLK